MPELNTDVWKLFGEQLRSAPFSNAGASIMGFQDQLNAAINGMTVPEYLATKQQHADYMNQLSQQTPAATLPNILDALANPSQAQEPNAVARVVQGLFPAANRSVPAQESQPIAAQPAAQPAPAPAQPVQTAAEEQRNLAKEWIGHMNRYEMAAAALPKFAKLIRAKAAQDMIADDVDPLFVSLWVDNGMEAVPKYAAATQKAEKPEQQMIRDIWKEEMLRARQTMGAKETMKRQILAQPKKYGELDITSRTLMHPFAGELDMAKLNQFLESQYSVDPQVQAYMQKIGLGSGPQLSPEKLQAVAAAKAMVKR